MIQTLASGRGLVESPRWHGDRVWFADWIAGEILAVDAGGDVEVVVRHPSLPLCFDFLPDGTLVVVSAPHRAVCTLLPDGSLHPYADLSALSPHAANDIVTDGRGNAYVDHPGYDPMAGPPPDADPGWIAMVTPDGSARIVADGLGFPNGLALTADGATLLVAESHRSRITAFDVAGDGSLSGRRVWAGVEDSAPDGICLDAEGSCWYADVPNRRCVRVRAGGLVLQTVHLDQGAYACALGGVDRPTLFVTVADWPGMAGMRRTEAWHGRLLATPVDVARAERPARSD